MITASFSSNHELMTLSLKVKGHAGQAEIGHDIVCASASILAYTLAQVIESYKHNLDEEPTIRLESGDTIIACSCKYLSTFAKAINAFQFAKTGYMLLAQNYPQFVEVKDV